MNENFSALLQDCLEIARQSGEIIKKAWEKPAHVRHKGAIDLVTDTDMAVQAFLREKLAPLCKDAAFLGEENDSGPNADPESGLCWIVDPVDGTTNFVHRIPFVATSIALCEKGSPRIGIVNIPMLGECFYAAKAHGAFCNGKKISVSRTVALKDALVATGFPYEIAPEITGIIRRLGLVLPQTRGLRRLGAAAIDLAYVACGRLDAFYETCLKPWDVAGGILLVTEAGGRISNFSGNTYAFGQPVLADNGFIHEDMLALVQARNGQPA